MSKPFCELHYASLLKGKDGIMATLLSFKRIRMDLTEEKLAQLNKIETELIASLNFLESLCNAEEEKMHLGLA